MRCAGIPVGLVCRRPMSSSITSSCLGWVERKRERESKKEMKERWNKKNAWLARPSPKKKSLTGLSRSRLSEEIRKKSSLMFTTRLGNNLTHGGRASTRHMAPQ